MLKGNDVERDIERSREDRNRMKNVIYSDPKASLTAYQKHRNQEGLVKGTLNYWGEAATGAWRSYRARRTDPEGTPEPSGKSKHGTVARALSGNVKKRLDEGKNSRYLAAKADLAYKLSPAAETAMDAAEAYYRVFDRTGSLDAARYSEKYFDKAINMHSNDAKQKIKLRKIRRTKFIARHNGLVYPEADEPVTDYQLALADLHLETANRPNERLNAALYLGHLLFRSYVATRDPKLVPRISRTVNVLRYALKHDSELSKYESRVIALERNLQDARELMQASKKKTKNIKG